MAATALAATGSTLITAGVVSYIPCIFAGSVAAYGNEASLPWWRHAIFIGSFLPPSALVYGGFRLSLLGLAAGASPLVPVVTTVAVTVTLLALPRLP